MGAARAAVTDGYTDVARFLEGDYGWLTANYAFDTAGRAAVQALLDSGGKPIDTRSQALYDAGHLPGAEHADAATILLNPAAFLSGRSPGTPLLIYGAGAPDATLRQVALALESQANHPRMYLYTGGYADWSAP